LEVVPLLGVLFARPPPDLFPVVLGAFLRPPFFAMILDIIGYMIYKNMFSLIVNFLIKENLKVIQIFTEFNPADQFYESILQINPSDY